MTAHHGITNNNVTNLSRTLVGRAGASAMLATFLLMQRLGEVRETLFVHLNSAICVQRCVSAEVEPTMPKFQW